MQLQLIQLLIGDLLIIGVGADHLLASADR
jgi:hypothetical protein